MKLLKIGIALTLMSAFAFGVARQEEYEVMGMKGKTMVPFAMTDLAGKKHTNASVKGKVVLLDFWATWCPPCRAASPKLQELHTKYAEKGLMIIGATSGEEDPKAAATGYVKEHGYTYTVTYDNDALAKAVGVPGYPTFLLIDKNGVIQNVWVGFGPGQEQQFEEAIKKLL